MSAYQKNGKHEYWEFSVYLGTDPHTGKRIRKNKRKATDGRPFKTKREAKLEVARLQLLFDKGELFKYRNGNLKTF